MFARTLIVLRAHIYLNKKKYNAGKKYNASYHNKTQIKFN